VAVVQISRIQIRRGRKNSGTGLPQLASGELGWAVDTQELFIGNGSVSEGAPYVGNTQLLTEHTNIFELADNYTYKKSSGNVQTGINTNNPVVRSLQDRLDDIVSVKSFGATGDGTTDDTAAVQRAIDQLFLNPATKGSERSRVTLYIEPGVYKLTNTINIPPHATIRGAGSDKTIFNVSSDCQGAGFQTVNETSTPGNPAPEATSTFDNQPRNIHFSGCTIQLVNDFPILVLKSCRDSYFEDIKVKGIFTNGDSSGIDNDPPGVVDYQSGLVLLSLSSVVGTRNNVFYNFTFEDLDYGIVSKFDIENNLWDSCQFQSLGYGIMFGEGTSLAVQGQLTGPQHNTVTNCEFRDIDRNAISVKTGKFNTSSLNRFFSVGNNSGIESNATYSVIEFLESTNKSTNDYFSRTADLSYDQTYINNNVYVPEVSGHAIYENGYTNRVRVLNYTSAERLFRLPAEATKSFEIDYLYVSNQVDAMRQGTLEITINPSGAGQLHLVDNFDYVGDSGFEENLTLTAQLFDEDFDGTLDTVAVLVLNSTTSDDADFYFTIKTKV
jgi:hypothetical protein